MNAYYNTLGVYYNMGDYYIMGAYYMTYGNFLFNFFIHKIIFSEYAFEEKA